MDDSIEEDGEQERRDELPNHFSIGEYGSVQRAGDGGLRELVDRRVDREVT